MSPSWAWCLTVSAPGSFSSSNQGGSARAHSAPLLVIPVLYSGGVGADIRSARGLAEGLGRVPRRGNTRSIMCGQQARVANSLILTAGQPTRRSRLWWRTVLSQFGASDVIVPVARLERQWPGGPVRGYFTARYGPDNTWLDSFELTANDEAGVAPMLAQAIKRFDRIYAKALADGLLQPDPTLYSEQQTMNAALAALAAAAQPKPVAGPALRTKPGAAPKLAARRCRHRWTAVSSYHRAVRLARCRGGRCRAGRGARRVGRARRGDIEHRHRRHLGDARELMPVDSKSSPQPCARAAGR